MERYSEYKDSGVQWLGEIPSHWELLHLRNFLTLFSEKGFPDSQLLSVTREKGVILRDKDNKEENRNYVPEDLSGYKHLNVGDFVINKMITYTLRCFIPNRQRPTASFQELSMSKTNSPSPVSRLTPFCIPETR